MLFINALPVGNLTRNLPPERKRAWHELTNLPDPRCDPYLIWFDLSYDTVTDDKGQRTPLSPNAAVDILLEISDAAVSDPAKAKVLLDDLEATFGFVPRTESRPHAQPYRFVCGSLPIASMVRLSEAIAMRQPSQWQWDLRFELASARYIGDADTSQLHPRSVKHVHTQQLGLPKTQAALAWPSPPFPPATRWAASRFGFTGRDGLPSAPLVAVIDDFCNHRSHALAGQVRSIWHQGRPPIDRAAGAAAAARVTVADDDPATENYGDIELLKPRPGQQIGRPASPAAYDERHGYPRRGLDGPVLSWTHGSAVLSMLARGNRPRPPCTSPDGLSALDAPPDIEFVQLPDVAVLDTSGGSLSGFALDAIHRAVRLACHDDPRSAVIVNLSFGTHSGPHDGTSMFERALLELLGRFDGSEVQIPQHGKGRLPVLHVVLPAGNTHLERTHASARLAANGGSEELLWMIPPDTDADSFVEFWFDDDLEQRVEIELLPPSADRSPGRKDDGVARPGQMRTWANGPTGAPDTVLHAAVIYPRSTSKGLHGRLALVAVAPTQQRANQGLGETYRSATDGPPQTDAKGRIQDALERVRMQAAPGCWTLRLTNHGTQPVQFHAWIQRHDAAPGRRRASKGHHGRQSSFVEAPGNAIDPRFTLSGIATATCPGRLWVVGAMDERGGIPLYAAAGPDRRFGQRIDGPDAALVVDRSRNVPGRHVHGVLSGARLRLGGTSIAAAAFTRMLYHTLALGGAMAWCRSDKPAPPPVRTAETPEMAEDWMRGSFQRLRHKNDLAVRGSSCPDPSPAGDDALRWAR